MTNEVAGIAIGVFAIVIVVLFYMAIVGNIVFSFQVYFGFWDRVAFFFAAILIILMLYFGSSHMQE